MTGSGPHRTIAYLTGQYPRATDTWIQREIAFLRAAGTPVETFAIRRPGDEHMVGPEQRAERDGTTYLFPRLTPGALARAHGRLLVWSPRRYGRALRLAAATRRPGLRPLVNQLAYFLEAGLLAVEVVDRGITHLHNHFGDSSATVAMVAAELGGFDYSLTLHGPGIFFEAGAWRLDEKLRRAAFGVCISYFCRSQAAIFADPADLERIHIVHCGVDTDSLRPVTHRGPGHRLLLVARLDEVKGVPVLLDAMTEVVAGRGQVTATIVGDGPSRARFEDRAAELGLADRIDFVGARSRAQVIDHLAEADVFVLPSFAEGVPVTLMEAMGSQLPVVATSVGGVSELVVHGVNGFLVRPGDPAELAGRIGELLDDGDLRQRLGQAGRLKVEAEFSNRTESARLQTLFDRSETGLTSALRPLPAGP